MKDLAKKAWPDALVVIAFLAVAFIYFFTPLSEGLVLGGHDTVAGLGQGHEQQLYREATGEVTRWTGSIFSGMPTYQIAPTYGPTQLLGKIGWVLALFTTGPLNYVFVYLLGFYLLMRVCRLRPLTAALGSVAWAFSSYFFIIIAAGHIWKVLTLGFIPPTIAGLVLAYRGKYLWGCLVTALFTALQVVSNHLQMTYYFLFLMAFIVIAYGVNALIESRKGGAAGTEGAPVLAGAPSATVPGVSTPVTPAPATPAPVSPLRHWLRATAAIVVGGLMGALINLPSLYHTWEYSHESMRGPSELTTAKATAEGAAAQNGGLDRDYITAWSYGVDETMTLMIPMYKGGGSQSIFADPDLQDRKGYAELQEHAGALYQAAQGQIDYLPGTSQYWGEQPMTVGPVYVGAIICFLFVLGLFVVRGPMKWALLCATVLSLLFAWGKNIMPLTDFFIDHLPMYNKFRTVSSALVVAELTMPMLGVLGLAEVLRNPRMLTATLRGRIGMAVSTALTLGTCLLFAAVPSLADCISGQDVGMLAQLQEAGLPYDFCMSYREAIITFHQGILATSALRSALLIAAVVAVILAFVRWPQRVPAPAVLTVALALTLADMWNVNRNYLNDDNFQTDATRTEGFAKTAADERILQDTDPDFRVLNLSTGNPFNESTNHTAYWHKSIGGYHAAKLHRYQDLIDRYLHKECSNLRTALSQASRTAFVGVDSVALDAMSDDEVADRLVSAIDFSAEAPVLCMLNAKWLIVGGSEPRALPNRHALGAAWYLDALRYVDSADAEIAALADSAIARRAVADKRFEAELGQAFSAAPPTSATAHGEETPLPAASDARRVTLTSYQPNELRYEAESPAGGVIAFSEVYYPGWTATVDGQDVPVGRINYILRAIRVPEGKHEVVLTFRPATLTLTNAIAYTALTLLLAGFLLAACQTFRRRRQQ